MGHDDDDDDTSIKVAAKCMLSLAGCRTSIEAFKIIFTFSELVTNNVYFPSQNNRRNTTIIHQVLLQFVSQDVHYTIWKEVLCNRKL